MLPVLAIDPYGLLARLIKEEREKRNSRGIKCGNMGQFLVVLFVIYEILTLDEYVSIQEAVWVIKSLLKTHLCYSSAPFFHVCVIVYSLSQCLIQHMNSVFLVDVSHVPTCFCFFLLAKIIIECNNI